MCDHMSVFLLVESCSQPAGPSPQVHQPGVGLQGQQLAHLAHHLHRDRRTGGGVGEAGTCGSVSDEYSDSLVASWE